MATAELSGLSLASLDDVGFIVSAYVGHAIRADPASRTNTDFLVSGEEIAARMADAFFGRDPDFEATPWNDPLQLGYGFGSRVGLEGDAEQVMLAFWIGLASSAQKLAESYSSGEIDGEQASFQLEVLIEEARYALLGMPLSAD